jgi:hypothetical protein
LAATYYDNPDFSGRAVSRVDAQVSFNWGTRPPVSGFDVGWSARWTGYVQAQHNQVYTFQTRVSGGVRLWVNGQLLIDRWKEQRNAQFTGKIALLAGQKYDIKVEYYDTKGSALLELGWSSASTRKQIIPAAQFSTVQPPEQIARRNAGILMIEHDPTRFAQLRVSALLLSSFSSLNLPPDLQQPDVLSSSPSSGWPIWAAQMAIVDS